MKVCSVNDCGTKVIARGLCVKHYNQWRRGKLKIDAERVNNSGEVACSITGCHRPARSKRLCGTHYERLRITGTTAKRPSPTKEEHSQWAGDAPQYSSAHQRLYRYRGKASDYPCVDCGLTADQWAYDHSDPNEMLNDKGHPYSAGMNHYQPMCLGCHIEFDRNRGKPVQEARHG